MMANGPAIVRADDKRGRHGLRHARSRLRPWSTRSVPSSRPLRRFPQIQLLRLDPSLRHPRPQQNLNLPLPLTDIQIRTVAVVPFWLDCILGRHACAFDLTVHVSVYTHTEELAVGPGAGVGPLYE